MPMKKSMNLQKRASVVLVALLFFSYGCVEVVNFDGTSTISGQIETCDEFGIENDKVVQASVTLDKTSFTTITDETGFFTFKDVPTGSYDLVVKKEGYGDRIIRDVNVFMGKDTFNLGKIKLIQPSTIEIQNFSIEKEGDFLYAKGKIIHKFPIKTNYPRTPIVYVYYNDRDNVSQENYIRYNFIVLSVPTNTEFRERVYWIYAPYSSDQTYYYIAYGASVGGFTDQLYDPETGFYINKSTLWGKPSNICSLKGGN
jgi:hypothetical protein